MLKGFERGIPPTHRADCLMAYPAKCAYLNFRGPDRRVLNADGHRWASGLAFFLFQLIVVASVLMMAAIVYLTIRSTTYYMERVQWANNQLEAVTALTVNANRYSEQIAEFLLIGEPERSDYESASAELEAGFDALEKLTLGEAVFLGRNSEQENDGDEIFRITRMCALYGEISKATARAIDLHNKGRQEDAVMVFRRDIENRFNAELPKRPASSCFTNKPGRKPAREPMRWIAASSLPPPSLQPARRSARCWSPSLTGSLAMSHSTPGRWHSACRSSWLS